MLQDDYEISREDIQALSKRDALAGFFAQLGYDTNERLVQNVGAMGFTSEQLKSSITHIERLARTDGGALEVYLIELTSVTVSVTQALARAFRNLSVDVPLLVLTDDYQRLDFVLVERYTATPKVVQENMAGFARPAQQVRVRPRVLTVNRLKPSDIAVRVLRRFRYTESDAYAQHEKILGAYVVADWSEPFFNNRALFSDHYLTQRLPDSPAWRDQANAASMTSAFQALRDLYADAREIFTNASASLVRTNLLQPALAILGFVAQPVAKREPTAIEPTYRLYAQAEPDAVAPLALCLAYPWGRSLDGKDEQRDDETPDDNPGALVVSLLERDEANWAIVTNGKIWRLYSAKAHSRATNYYEIDLEEALVQPAVHREIAFRYFWYFFRASAFQPVAHLVDGETRLLCFLDILVSDSERYAHELGKRLKERVFFEIFPHFARGFILHARQTGLLPAQLETLPAEERRDLLKPFFHGTLTFLYRLLFLLYAESRDLLPVREARGYYETSLEKLKREIADKGGSIEDLAPEKLTHAYTESSTALYDRLQILFQAVDVGNAEINVPVYNGGLFVTQPKPALTSPEAAVARFLATCKIPDRQLALGLDRMARDRDEKQQDLVFIDYKSLGVRELGSMYEGLLEFTLHIAPTDMAIVKGKKKTEEIVPYAEAVQQKLPLIKEGRGREAHDKIVPKDTVYLENDRRERKATGSYYTPDYIVKYIVEHTVGPVLQAKLEALRPVFREAEKTLRNQREKANALRKQGMRADDPEHETYLHFRKSLNEVFFDLKVLDPAMGSGHFLVEVVDAITDRMADFLAAFRWNPVVHELAQTRRDIQEEMERQSISIDISKLTDLNLLKRRVLKSCIYGVDLNPMAVELAKVSLWLDCFTLGAPLSFLDHHMKCGNSLLGGNVQEVQNAVGNSLWGNQFTYLLDATQLMRKVGELSDATAQEIAASKTAYQGAYDALAPFKRLLDVWLSEYFDNKGAKGITRDRAGAIYDNTYSSLDQKEQEAIKTALKLATEKRFFHWELEFPEVFFDEVKRKEQGGFDAVVGNPPYVRQEGLGEDKVAFKEAYAVFSSIADLYVYFIERGHTLLRHAGHFGMITANKFMRANYGAALRSFLINQAKLEKLIDFGDLPVFDEAIAYPTIILSSNDQRRDTLVEYALIKTLTFDSLAVAIQSATNKMPESAFGRTNWSLAVGPEQGVLDKLKEKSITLEKYTNGTIRRGILTGFNEAFIIDGAIRDRLIAEDPKSAEIIKPFVVGEDVKRYDINFNERFLIFTRRSIDITQYKAIEQHLLQYKSQLEPKPANWIDEKMQWLGRKPGPYKWYEIQDNIAYYADFDKPKIVYPNICMQPEFAYDVNNYYSNQKTFIIPIADLYLLCVLNSGLMKFILDTLLPKLRGGFFEPGYIFMKDVPIRQINFTLTPEQRAHYLVEAKDLYQQCLARADQAALLHLVKHHLAQQPEESDVVHDLLAFLAEEMLRLNMEKRATQREFLDWLVATLKILPDKEGRVGIDALTGKAKLADYAGNYQKDEPALSPAELLEIVRKNKQRLGVSLNDLGLLDKLEKMYEASLQRVLPLKETLRQTDALIDAVVYRLYGLTEEEIGVVEGKA